MTKNTPLDLKLVSIFFLFSSFSFLSVNTNYNYFFGITVTGIFSKSLWVISSLVFVVGAVGLWKRNLKILKIIIFYFAFNLLNYLMWFFFVPLNEKALIITTTGEPHVLNKATTLFYFICFTLIQVLFIGYLFKRKKIFK